MNFLSTALLFLVSLFGVNLTCLHKGCPLTPGLKIEHLEAAIQVGLCPSEFWKDIFRVVQWNILYDKTNGSDSWENRKKDLCDYIRRMKPTVFGLQEVMRHQLDYLRSCLPRYNFAGLPIDSTPDALYNPVFYENSSRIQYIDSGTFWLSETPDQSASMLPNANYSRICSWVKLNYYNSVTWKTIFVATTHITYTDEYIADQQVKILLSYLLHNVLKNKPYPIILTGDFNWDDLSAMYNTMEQSNWFHNSMAIARLSLSQLTALDPYAGLVDYIWESNAVSLLSATMMDTRPNGRMLSDHRPVFGAFLL